jgi:hypothetical protein
LPPLCGQRAAGRCPLRLHSATTSPEESPE